MDNIDIDQVVPPLWKDPHATHMHYWFDTGDLGLKRGLCVLPQKQIDEQYQKLTEIYDLTEEQYRRSQRTRFNMDSINIPVKWPEEKTDA